MCRWILLLEVSFLNVQQPWVPLQWSFLIPSLHFLMSHGSKLGHQYVTCVIWLAAVIKCFHILKLILIKLSQFKTVSIFQDGDDCLISKDEKYYLRHVGDDPRPKDPAVFSNDFPGKENNMSCVSSLKPQIRHLENYFVLLNKVGPGECIQCTINVVCPWHHFNLVWWI